MSKKEQCVNRNTQSNKCFKSECEGCQSFETRDEFTERLNSRVNRSNEYQKLSDKIFRLRMDKARVEEEILDLEHAISGREVWLQEINFELFELEEKAWIYELDEEDEEKLTPPELKCEDCKYWLTDPDPCDGCVANSLFEPINIYDLYDPDPLRDGGDF